MEAVAIKYKDHTVAEKFIKNGKTTEEAAYINASYKGILRLSPNNSDSLSLTQSAISSSKYIMFEDSVTELLKTNYISVSTSDGIILDMRISNEGVEYSSLNILGELNANSIEIFYKGEFSFLFGNATEMPKKYNSKAAVNTGTYSYEPMRPDNINDFYYLSSNSVNKREFDFYNVNESIDSFVKENLLKVSGVPTGSIHYIPINPQYYKEIYLDNLEASLAGEVNTHNAGTLNNNPLIRDYLVCDGSKYNNIDYPELAKVLYGTTVTYWEKNSEGYSEKKTYTNNYANEKCFRVPDLRVQFIQSVDDLSIRGSSKNETGKWEIDSTIESIKYAADDNHYHYIVLDSFKANGSYNFDASDNLDAVTNGDKVTYVDNLSFSYNRITGITGGNPRPLARLANITTKGYGPGGCWGCCCCDKVTSSVYGTWPITGGRTTFGGAGAHAGSVFGATCGYFLSVPPSYNYVKRTFNGGWIGKTSGAIPMEIANNDMDLPSLNYTKNDTIHSEKTYIDYSGGNTKNLIGYENTPEFYAMLPLIKI
jgi:hypothetical protein